MKNTQKSGQLTVESAMDRARKLPAPVPGMKVNVPLELVPAYIALHGLNPTGWMEPETLTVKREQRSEL